jgi:hypothetical protein
MLKHLVYLFFVLGVLLPANKLKSQGIPGKTNKGTSQVALLKELRQPGINADPRKAISVYEELIAQNPFEPAYHYAIGEMYYRLGEFTNALTSFKKAKQSGYYYTGRVDWQLARCFSQLQIADSAINHLAWAIKNKFTQYPLFIRDSAFQNLKNNPDYQTLLGTLPDDKKDMDKVSGWRTDLAFLYTSLKETHYNLFNRFSEKMFDDVVSSLQANIPKLSDQEIIGAFFKITAMAGDGHTLVRPIFKELGTKYTFHVLPVKFYFLKDGLYVISASPEYKNIVGGRVTKFGNTPVDEVIKKIRVYIGGENEMFYKWNIPNYLAFADLLKINNICPSVNEATLTVVKNKTEEFTSRVSTIILSAADISKNENKTWAHMRDTSFTPDWLKNNDDFFWYSYKPDKNLVYFKFNQVLNKRGKTLAAFADSLFNFIESSRVENLVIDLRKNNGGDSYLNNDLIEKIIKSRVNKTGHLFIITGRESYSATINLCSDLETWTNCIFVGEPPSSSPNFIGENSQITLPYSKLSVSTSYIYFQKSYYLSLDKRPWIAPQLAAELSADEFIHNTDPCMNLVFEYISSR